MSKKEDISKYVYHYTSIRGFKGIIKDREIWATDLRYMNDPTELELGYNYLNEMVCESVESGKTIKRDPNVPIFACSFSKNKNVLSQWRAYAKGGGVAIGFPRDLLQNVAAAKDYVLKDCIYYDLEDPTTKIQLVSKAIQLLELTDSSTKRGSNAKATDDSETDKLIALKSPWIVPVIKHKAYKEEDEVRLLPSSDSSSVHEINIAIGRQSSLKREFRVDNGILKPYQAIKLGEAFFKIQIVVGPTPHQDLIYDSVKRFLYQELVEEELVNGTERVQGNAERKYKNYVEEAVTKSDVPYRDM